MYAVNVINAKPKKETKSLSEGICSMFHESNENKPKKTTKRFLLTSINEASTHRRTIRRNGDWNHYYDNSVSFS